MKAQETFEQQQEQIKMRLQTQQKKKDLDQKDKFQVQDKALIKQNQEADQQNKTQKNHNFTYNIVGEKVVGNGTFGVVFQGIIQETGEIVAIKKVFQDKRYKNRELQMMQQIGQHPNLIQLRHHFYSYGEDQDEVYLNLIMDYIPETLYQIIKFYNKRRNSSVPNILIKLYSYQLLRSLAYIQGIGICHRDIKPTNVLIDPRDHSLKLCDLGSAKKLEPNQPNIFYICSRYYRAPELMMGQVNYKEEIDVWSVGTVIAEMIIGEPIFIGQDSLDQLIRIISILGTPTKQELIDMNPDLKQIDLPKIKKKSWSKVFKDYNADPQLVDLISKLLVYSPQKRLKPLEALCHPYFDELRQKECKINNQPLPDLFNFVEEEIMQSRHLLNKLIPKWYIQDQQQIQANNL